ncbi:MAG: hypothetical protein HQK77_16605 [Desulfobacterales bacterium]|nr:hypothetical protein [Desulfobacterales bacterium]
MLYYSVFVLLLSLVINSFQPSNALAAVLSNNQDFVAQQYRDFLNREGDPGGINFWVDA